MNLPCNVEAEKIVLSTAMLYPETAPGIVAALEPDDFFDVRHREIFRAISELVQASEPIDLATISDKIDPKLSGVITYASEISDNVPVGGEAHVNIILERSALRKGILLCDQAKQSLMNANGDTGDAMQAVQSSFINLFYSYIERRHSTDPNCLQLSTTSTPVYINFKGEQAESTLLNLATSLVKSEMPQENVTKYITYLAGACNPPYPQEKVDPLITGAVKAARNRDTKLSQEVREWVLSTSGNFSSTYCLQCLHLSTRQEKKNLSIILKRLTEEGVIEKYGEKAGNYRVVENGVEVMDLFNAPTNEFPVELPLGLSEKVKLYPGNMVIVAGAKSAGKTAFLLNCLRLNMFKHDIPPDYMTSEMGETEFRLRLEAFENMQLTDWRFRPIHRSHDWWDLITDEKKVFIIDYVEPPEDKLYLVGSILRKIHDKLKNGIAIIGLQKDPGRDVGRGNTFSMDKCKAYFALDYDQGAKCNIVKIVDAKAWRGGENPKGMSKAYKLSGGANYHSEGFWIER